MNLLLQLCILRMLYDRVPIIEGVETSEQGLIDLRSKFINKFQTIDEFTGSKYTNTIGQHSHKLQFVEGAEKLFAAIIFGGEHDIHAGNLGIINVKDEQGNDKKIFAKIDHGWSATNFSTDPARMMKNFLNAYEIYGYDGKINLDITKFREAFEEILKISDEEIEKILKSRVHKLKKMGLKIENLNFRISQNDEDHNHENTTNISFKNFDELENYYIANYKGQRITFEKLKDSLLELEKILIDLINGLII